MHNYWINVKDKGVQFPRFDETTNSNGCVSCEWSKWNVSLHILVTVRSTDLQRYRWQWSHSHGRTL